MVLNYQTIAIPFGQGLDTQTDEKTVPTAKLSDLQNGVFTERVTVKKRNGYTALTTNIHSFLSNLSISTADALVTRQDELIELSDNTIYSYSPASAGWLTKGTLYNVRPSEEAVAQLPAVQSQPDCASAGGVVVYAWEDSRGGVRYAIFNETTGATIIDTVSLVSTSSRPRCVAIDGFLQVVYYDSDVNSLKTVVINPTNLTVLTLSNKTLVGDVHADAVYDIALIGTKAAIAYKNSTGAITLGYLTSSGLMGSPGVSLPSPISFATPSVGPAIAADPNTNRLMVIYYDTSNGLQGRVYDAELNLVAGAAVLDSDNALDVRGIVVGFDAEMTGSFTTAQIFYEVGATDSWNHYIKHKTYNTSGGGGAITTLMRHAGLASRVFSTGGKKAQVNLQHQSGLQNTYFTIDSDGHIIARLGAGEADTLISNQIYPQVQSMGNSKWAWVGEYRRALPVKQDSSDTVNPNTPTTFSETGVKKFTLDFNPENPYPHVEVGETVYIQSGLLHSYDGLSATENNFLLFPENISAVGTTTGAGGITNGTYSYNVYWEWTNNLGQREQSTTASGVQVAVSGDDAVQLTVPTLSFTKKQTLGDFGNRANVRLAVYRTEDDGNTFYRVDDPSSPVYNDPDADTVNFTDELSDTTLTTRELDYRNAELEHTAPPTSTLIAAAQDRIFLAGLENAQAVRYSKLHNWPDGVSFSDLLEIEVDDAGGPITGLAPLDENLVVFKKHRIFLVAGIGVDNTGGGQEYVSRLISSDVGCTNSASIVPVNNGVMFQSEKGIYLFDGNQGLRRVGAEVERYQDQTFTAAHLLQDQNQVRFLTNSGRTLVYDYEFDQWSTFTINGIDAVLWNDTYTFLQSNGVVLQETEGVFTDNNAPYRLVMETSWLRLRNLLGYQKVRWYGFIGDGDDGVRVRVGWNINYHNDYPVTREYTHSAGATPYGSGLYGDGLYGGGQNGILLFRGRVKPGRVQAIRFRIEDVPGTDPNKTYELSELALHIGFKPGVSRLNQLNTL